MNWTKIDLFHQIIEMLFYENIKFTLNSKSKIITMSKNRLCQLFQFIIVFGLLTQFILNIFINIVDE